MKAQNELYEKIWRRFADADQQLLKIEAELAPNNTPDYTQKHAEVSALFKKRLHIVPNMATGQYFILQLVNRFGFDIAEIASWCNLSSLMILGIYQGKNKQWSSSAVFERLLRFYCVVLRHNLQPSQKAILH